MIKISKLKNFNKILLGVIVFFAASVNVFAANPCGNNKSTTCISYNLGVLTLYYRGGQYPGSAIYGAWVECNGIYIAGTGTKGGPVGTKTKILANGSDFKSFHIPIKNNSNFKSGTKYSCVSKFDRMGNYGVPGGSTTFSIPDNDSDEMKATMSGWYICGGTCKEFKIGAILDSNCNNKWYNSKTNCDLFNVGNPSSDTKKYLCKGSYNDAWKKETKRTTNEITPSDCNQITAPNYKSVWDSSADCCRITKRITGVGDKASNYTVLFDQHKGYGIPCENGVCSVSVKKNEKAKFPVTKETNMKNGIVMYRDGYGKLIGWDNQFDANGEPYCQGGDDKESVAISIQKEAETPEITSDTTYKACYKEQIGGNRFLAKGAIADGLGDVQCGTEFKIEYCTLEGHDTLEQFCYYYDPSDGKTLRKVYRNKLTSSYAAASCDDNVIEEPKKEEITDISNCSPEEGKGNPGLNIFKHCYKKTHTNDEIEKNISNLFKCPTGYNISSISNADGVRTCIDEKCSNNFNVICSKGDNAKPRIAVSSVIADSTGYGDIKVTATAQEGVIQSYYVSSYYKTPPVGDLGWISLNGKTSFTYNSSPGVLFFWVKDSNGNISNAVSGAVFDTKNTDTTIKDFSLMDDSGNYQAPTRVSYNVDGVKNSNYVMMSNNLNKDSKVLADGFNPFDMQYELEVDSSTITVYATLTSTDSSYVPGYEPRTVNLSYGMNTILIKIQNNKGITRTYTILVTRKDTRTSDNTLSDISLSEGNITFNANVTDYKVEIPKSTTSVNVNSTIASDKASYVSGYEPGNVNITGDTTVKLIKVKSETGSTRTYVITFVKEGTDLISKESLQLSDLVIPNAYIPFESDVSNYSLSVAYETDSIDLNTVRKDKDSSVLISIKKKNDSDYKVVSDIGIGLDVGENFIEIRVKDIDGEVSYYRLTVIRKEFGLGISNDTSLKELRVLGYDIDFEPNKKEYTVRIKQEKTLVVTAVPESNRAEVFIRGNEELTGFSTVRVKVVAENGEFETYSIDIKKDAFNKTIEIAAIVAGAVIILASSAIIIVKKKSKAKREYFEE